MARHRNIRNTKRHDYDYDDDDVYGHSYEDDYGISPGTMAQYSYSRSRKNDFSSYMPSESSLPEDDVAEYSEQRRKSEDTHPAPQVPSSDNDILLQSCLETMHDVVGNSYSDNAMKQAALQCNYNVEEALNKLMSSPPPSNPSINSQNFEFSISQPPKEQRQRRDRRNQRGVNAVNSHVIPTTVTKVVTAGTPSKTGFVTSQSNSTEFKPSKINCSSPSVSKPQETSTVDQTDIKNLNADEKTPRKTNLPKPKQTLPVDQIDVKSPRVDAKTPRQNPPSKNLNNLTENASLTPNLKLNPDSETDFKKSKHALEMKERYEQRKQDSKPLISMVVIGHVDAGKSTLMGHLLYLAGEVSKRAMHKYEQESRKLGKASFAYAWVLDETGEERNRGVTMDVGLTKFETEHRFITLMDAPGHKDFIPNMITGASQADVAVLVVNATTGEFEAGFDLGGQTREHSLLIRSLGISQLAVAVNKLDTVDWSQKRFKDIVSKLTTFLKQAGFKESDVTYIPVSGLMGENLSKPATSPKLTSWYKGPSLIQVIDKFKPPQRPVDYPLRFCVTDVVRGQGTGINVSGKIETGGVKLGSKVVVLPAGENSLVKGIERHDGTRTEFALAGDHVTLTCHGVDIMKIHSGNVLSDISKPIPVVTQFRARIIIFNIEVPITRGFPVELHYKAAAEPAVLKRLISILNKSTGEVVTKKPKAVLKGQNVLVQVMVHRPICIEEYHKVKEMGRFTLRYAGSTIAAGVVTEVLE